MKLFPDRRIGGAICIALAMTVCGIATTAQASLGRSRDSVETDRVHLLARSTSVASASHTLHTLTLPNGGVVREFSRDDGTVFAVSWRAPGRPDLRQLLGVHFDTLQADTAARSGRGRRIPMGVDRSDLVIRTGGHPGAFWGIAYLPQQAPAGFSAANLQ